MAALDFIDKSLEGEDFQKRLESIILLTCKKIQSQNPEDAFRIENVKTVIQVPFHDILYFETSDIVHKVILYTKEEQIEFMAVSLKLKRVTLDCLNAINLSLSTQKCHQIR